jgi:hypothetical protein
MVLQNVAVSHPGFGTVVPAIRTDLGGASGWGSRSGRLPSRCPSRSPERELQPLRSSDHDSAPGRWRSRWRLRRVIGAMDMTSRSGLFALSTTTYLPRADRVRTPVSDEHRLPCAARPLTCIERIWAGVSAKASPPFGVDPRERRFSRVVGARFRWVIRT